MAQKRRGRTRRKGQSTPKAAARAKGKQAASPRPPAPRGSSPQGGRWLGVLRTGLGLVLAAVLGSVALVGLYRVLPPPLTLLMVERLAQGEGLHKDWRPIGDISPDLVRSVIAAEDAHFCSHNGFDLAAIRAAAAHNARTPHRVRGGSTISQQAAKNVFLWPQRSYLRKGLEAYYTVLIEALWGKRRIMEVYLNVVEWGPGVYGAQAASLRYFGHDAGSLSVDEAARLAAVVPDPLKWRAVRPGRYVAERSRRIVAAAQIVEADALAACVLRGG